MNTPFVHQGDLKQPYEGIVGTDRSGSDLLALTGEALEHRNALLAMAHLLHRAALIASVTTAGRRLYAHITQPTPGDLVAEWDAAFLGADEITRRHHSLGFLLAVRVEWAQTDEEWTALSAEDRAQGRDTEDVHYVQYGPAPEDICRWANCEFLVLPVNDFRALIGRV